MRKLIFPLFVLILVSAVPLFSQGMPGILCSGSAIGCMIPNSTYTASTGTLGLPGFGAGATSFLTIGHDAANGFISMTGPQAGGFNLLVNGGTAAMSWDTSGNGYAKAGLYPDSDNAMAFGLSSQRWSRGFMVTSQIGTTGTSGSLDLGGNFYWSGYPSLSTALSGAICMSTSNLVEVNTNAGGCLVSSERFKKNIAGLGHGLDWIMRMRPVTWNWKDPAVHQPQAGPGTAESMAKIDPSLTEFDKDGQPYSINDRVILGVAVKAIQEQQKEIRNLWIGLFIVTGLAVMIMLLKRS